MQTTGDDAASDARQAEPATCRACAGHEQAMSLLAEVYVSEVGKYVAAVKRRDFSIASEHAHAVRVLGDLMIQLDAKAHRCTS